MNARKTLLTESCTGFQLTTPSVNLLSAEITAVGHLIWPRKCLGIVYLFFSSRSNFSVALAGLELSPPPVLGLKVCTTTPLVWFLSEFVLGIFCMSILAVAFSPPLQRSDLSFSSKIWGLKIVLVELSVTECLTLVKPWLHLLHQEKQKSAFMSGVL